MIKNSINNFDFRPAPFWFLNYELDDNEIIRQLDLMVDANISGMFLHPRAGNYLQTYGSKEWFAKIKFIVEEAKKRNLKIWLYDEDPYPSGAAGARTYFEDNNLAAKQLYFIVEKPKNNEIFLKLGQAKVLSAYAIKANNNRIIDKIDLKESLGTIRDQFFMSQWNSSYYYDIKKDFPHVRSGTFLPQMAIKTKIPNDYTIYVALAKTFISDDKYGYMPDNLNPKGVDLFIELTHKKYKDYLEEDFGKKILGIFTDEPSPGPIMPYTDKLFDIFYKEYKYKLEDNIFHLIGDFGEESRKVRLDYYYLINKLFHNTFYKKISQYNKRNKLLTTGHIINEEDLASQALVGENVYQAIKYFDIPGFDITGNNIGDNEHFALCMGGKIVSSSAYQKGKNIVMSELMSNSPMNYDIEGMNRLAYFMYALGINFLVPHAFYYSIDGYRKFDAGTSLFFQFKDFDLFSDFSNMAKKFGSILSASKSYCNTCIVLPMRELYKTVSYDYNQGVIIANKIVELSKKLSNNHIEYQFIDDDTFIKNNVKNKFLNVGKAKYNNIILLKTEDVLINNKINLIKSEVNIMFCDNFDVNMLHNPTCTVIQSIIGNIADIMVLKKKYNDNFIYYIFNNSKNEITFNAKLTSQFATIIFPYDNDKKIQSKDGFVELTIEGYDSFIIKETNKNTNLSIYNKKNENKIKSYVWQEKPIWDYYYDKTENYTIEKYDITINSDDNTCTYQEKKYCLIRDVYGVTRDYLKQNEVIPIFDKVGKNEQKPLYPVNAIYKSKFNLTKTFNFLLIENDTFKGNFSIYINNVLLDNKKFYKKLYYDFNNKICDVKDLLKIGENTIEIKFEKAYEFDGIYSLICLVD